MGNMNGGLCLKWVSYVKNRSVKLENESFVSKMARLRWKWLSCVGNELVMLKMSWLCWE